MEQKILSGLQRIFSVADHNAGNVSSFWGIWLKSETLQVEHLKHIGPDGSSWPLWPSEGWQQKSLKTEKKMVYWGWAFLVGHHHHHHHHHDNDHQYKGSHFDLADMPRGGSSTATQGFPVLPLARNVLLILSPVSWSTVFLYSVFFYILQLAHNVLILSCIIQLYFSQIQFPVCIS